MNLPKEFIFNMKELLGQEYEEFEKSYMEKRLTGIRVNTLKITVDEFQRITPFELTRIPWTEDGFYVDSWERPGKHPFWHAGLYYIQEPSAMLPVELMGLTDDFSGVILDMCASPGGKTVQIAGKASKDALIVTNDISAGRVKALVRNVEQFGATNVIVLNEDHHRIKGRFSNGRDGIFDAILLDVPCSGEGMFRKDDSISKYWTTASNEKFSIVQKEIMEAGISLLKSGGRLVYSTCTFSEKENEQILAHGIDQSNEAVDYDEPNISLKARFMESGIRSYKSMFRIWPHLVKGEGHFAGRICKRNEIRGDDISSSADEKLLDRFHDEPPKELLDFMNDEMTSHIKGPFELIDSRIFKIPLTREGKKLDLSGMRVARSGWLLGEIKKDRFEPSQFLAMGSKSKDFNRVIDFKVDDPNLLKYLKCETLHLEGENGLNLITVLGYPLGFGKMNNGTLKNLYNKAWRMM